MHGSAATTQASAVDRGVDAARASFAATFVAVGIAGFVGGDLAPVWQAVPSGFPLRAPLAVVTSTLSIAAGLGLLSARLATTAAATLLAMLTLWLGMFKAPLLLRGPLVAVYYENMAETTTILAATWALLARAARDDRAPRARAAAGLRGARMLYALSMIAFGVAHFAYLAGTAALVPHWLPAPRTWAGLTGATYIAAGAAILAGIRASLAARLSALQMSLFTLLVWVPIVLAGPNARQWGESVVSCVLATSGWVIAASYHNARRRGREKQSPQGGARPKAGAVGHHAT